MENLESENNRILEIEKQLADLEDLIDRQNDLIRRTFQIKSELDTENRFSMSDEQEPIEERQQWERTIDELNHQYDELHKLEKRRASLWLEKRGEK